jgi:hypothetical protein
MSTIVNSDGLPELVFDSIKCCKCVACIPCTVHVLNTISSSGHYELLCEHALLYYINQYTRDKDCACDATHQSIDICTITDNATSKLILLINSYSYDSQNFEFNFKDYKDASLIIMKVSSISLVISNKEPGCETGLTTYYKLTFADSHTLDSYLEICSDYICTIITNIDAVTQSCPLDSHIASQQLAAADITELSAQLHKKDTTITNLTQAIAVLRTEYNHLYNFCECTGFGKPQYLEQSALELGLQPISAALATTSYSAMVASARAAMDAASAAVAASSEAVAASSEAVASSSEAVASSSEAVAAASAAMDTASEDDAESTDSNAAECVIS